MGYWKEKQIEMDEAEAKGLYLPEAGECYLCAEHFKDVYIQRLILSNGKRGVCSYCGGEHIVMDLRDFVELIHGRITDYFATVTEECPPSASVVYDGDETDAETNQYFRKVGNGNFVVFRGTPYHESTDELLAHLRLYGDNDDLNNDLRICFVEHEWVKRDAFGLDEHEALFYSWEEFADSVITGRPIELTGDEWAEDEWIKMEAKCIVQSIGRMAQAYGLCHELPIGTILFRARNVDVEDEIKGFDDLTSPPDNCASQNRMSRAGVSMFYGAFSASGASDECVKSGKPLCAHGKFVTTRRLRVLDLSYLPPISFFMDGWQECRFLKDFHDDVSKPIAEEDKTTEYIPTQFFTEYIRTNLRDSDCKGMDGIIYNSSKGYSKNIVLFYDQKCSRSVLSLVEYGFGKIK